MANLSILISQFRLVTVVDVVVVAVVAVVVVAVVVVVAHETPATKNN